MNVISTIGRFVTVLAAVAIITGLVASDLSAPAPDGSPTLAGTSDRIDLVARVTDCEIRNRQGCTFVLTPSEQKVVVAGGAAALAVLSSACGPFGPGCYAAAAAGAAALGQYISDSVSGNCDMHIFIGVTDLGPTGPINLSKPKFACS
ncbi:MAG: hypothetical protein ACT4RN_15905 [Pseudonocardia sp.]